MEISKYVLEWIFLFYLHPKFWGLIFYGFKHLIIIF